MVIHAITNLHGETETNKTVETVETSEDTCKYKLVAWRDRAEIERRETYGD